MKLRTAVQQTPWGQTENHADTYVSSNSALIDFFFKAGSARNMLEHELCAMFNAALDEDPRLAFQTLVWLRDVRGGAGERRAFRVLLKHLANNINSFSYLHPLMQRLVNATADYGRFDDLLALMETKYEAEAVVAISSGLENPETSGLAAKWMPRQGPVAEKLRRYLGHTPKSWRKLLVNKTNVVEQQMCARDWKGINYSQVPSVATARYKRAFARHDPEGYEKWRAALVTGEATVNAGAIFPHDVFKGVLLTTMWASMPATVENREVIQAQWDALPNYLGDSKILPIVDTSGSMITPVSGNTTALEVAVGLGLYLAMKQTGDFSNLFMTFSASPQFQTLASNNVLVNAQKMVQADWGMNTNLQAAFDLLLRTARQNRVPAYEMPQTLLILSDMEFDYCAQGTNLDGMRSLYLRNGYKMPNVVFWNLNSRQRNNVPVQMHESGAALVSGYSPSILKGILKNDINPTAVFLNTVDVPRYQIF